MQSIRHRLTGKLGLPTHPSIYIGCSAYPNKSRPAMSHQSIAHEQFVFLPYKPWKGWLISLQNVQTHYSAPWSLKILIMVSLSTPLAWLAQCNAVFPLWSWSETSAPLSHNKLSISTPRLLEWRGRLVLPVSLTIAIIAVAPCESLLSMLVPAFRRISTVSKWSRIAAANRAVNDLEDRASSEAPYSTNRIQASL